MRENETGPHDSSYGDVFTELTDTLRERDDAGIIAFEANLREIQSYLANEYILPGKPLDYKEIADIDTDLGEAWAHESDVARVSGRIYIYDPEIEDMVPEEWGEGRLDEHEEIYYLVDNISLRSVTAQVLPQFDNDGNLRDVKMAYLFAFPDDEDEMPAVCAYLGELYEHGYDHPTPQEAATRLESQWPEQFARMQEWLHSGTNTQLVQRIQFLVHELQSELSASDQFRELFECYLQSFVTLDQTLPYSITVDGSLDYFDGKANPYINQEEGEWLSFTLEGELSLLGYYPKIEMQRRADGTVYAAMIIASFNTEDGDEAEYIRLDIDTVTSFRSTRAISSLLSKAIFHGNRGSIIEAVSPGGEYELNPIDTRDEVAIEVGPQEERHVERVPDYIEHLLAVEAAIAQAVAVVRSHRTVLFKSSEEARIAAEHMVNEEVLPLFRQLKVLNNLECTVSGQGVLMPHGAMEVTDPAAEGPLRSFTYTTNIEQTISALMPGDSYTGYLLKVIGAPDKVAAEDELDYHYRTQAALMVSVERARHIPLAINNEPLVDITIEKRLFVPLDGSSEVKLTVLENYRETEAILKGLQSEHAASTTVELLGSLREALYNDTLENAYVEFEQTELFSEIEEPEGEATLFKGTVELLEKLLVGRTLQINGEVVVQNGLDTFTPIEPLNDDMVVVGKVIDVRTDIETNDIYLAISAPESAMIYVRVRSITKFMF